MELTLTAEDTRYSLRKMTLFINESSDLEPEYTPSE